MRTWPLTYLTSLVLFQNVAIQFLVDRLHNDSTAGPGVDKGERSRIKWVFSAQLTALRYHSGDFLEKN